MDERCLVLILADNQTDSPHLEFADLKISAHRLENFLKLCLPKLEHKQRCLKELKNLHFPFVCQTSFEVPV